MPTPAPIDQALPDGTTVQIRPLRPDDGERLLAMWARTSERSRHLRFHGSFRLDESTVSQFVDFDRSNQQALAATLGRGDDEVLIGVARWVRDDERPDEAEFAVLVEDAHQGRGLGTALVRHLAVTAHDAGINVLSGDVLAENTAMLRVIRHLGFDHKDRSDHAVVRSDLGLELGEEFLAVGDVADSRAARAALARFLMPRSVALVGASRSSTTVGGQLIDNILSAKFSGKVHLVNPEARRIGLRSVAPSLSALSEVPELVVVAVPADAVSAVVDEAGSLGCRAVCVISAGFAEAGPDGEDRQDELLATAHAHGLRLIGPNCMGLLTTDPAVSLNASLSPTMPVEGSFAVASQSGAMGMAIIDMAVSRQLGLSSFVSLGNRVDISANDLLQYWELDDRTTAILLYLESFGDPRRFARIARRVSRQRPIVVVKAGRSTSGARAAVLPEDEPHAGDIEVDALFAQTGVIRTTSIPEMFDVAMLLDRVDSVRGNRVGIVSNAGGPGVLAADACEAHGLDVVPLSDTTIAALGEALPDHHHVTNPLDLIVGTSLEQFCDAIEIVGASGDVDALLAIHAPMDQADPEETATAIINARETVEPGLPVIAITMDGRTPPTLFAEAGVPAFSFPEAAASALGRLARHAEWQRRPLGEPVIPEDVDPRPARRVVDEVVASLSRMEHPAGRSAWLTWEQTTTVLDAYGVPQAPGIVVHGRDEAARAQRQLDAPVAVKLLDPVLRKTTTGGVELGRRSPRAAAAAVQTLRERFPANLRRGERQRFLVQRMATGIEMAVGVRHHPSFGPVVVTGVGGPHNELIGDLTARITPLTDRDTDEMLAALRMRPLLEGYRGAPPGDVDALKDLLARVSAMVEDLPEISELSLDPVFVMATGEGLEVADVRIRVRAVETGTS
jgi:acyl-CoA synthetase (NDP forming)/RimJ/RimL family protein N-acetyltransferase